MAGESQKEPTTGQADPSVLTTESSERAIRNLIREIDARLAVRDQRLHGIDKATEIFTENLQRVPSETQKEVAHLRNELDVRLNSLDRLDRVREEHRLELKADAEKALSTAREADQKAVAAALAAAEKARDQQTIASQLATSKAEVGFIDSLAKLTDTFTLAIQNVVTGLGEVKDRLTTIETRQFSAKEDRDTRRLDSGSLMTMLSLFVAGIAVLYAMFGK